MLAGKNKHFPPLTSASPRLLFDFLPVVRSPKDGEKTHAKRRTAFFCAHSLIIVCIAWSTQCSVLCDAFLTGMKGAKTLSMRVVHSHRPLVNALAVDHRHSTTAQGNPMKPALSSTNDKVVSNLNSLLRGEISAVETYNQAIKQLAQEPLDDLIANRNCHSKRVDLLKSNIAQHGATPDSTSGMWGSFVKLVEKGAALISVKSVIAALEEGEDRGLKQYRSPGDLDPSSIQLIQTVLLPRQLETHERMRVRKHGEA